MGSSDVLGKGHTALVTGASRGIGPLIAAELARHGGHVVLTGRSATGLKAVTSDLAANGADVSFLPADLTQPGAAEGLVHAVEQQHGGIDLLVNNAGGDPLREFHTMTIEENLRTLQLNLVAPVTLTHAVLPGMLLHGNGHIVNISAMAGRVSFPFTEVYAAAKDGLIGFTRVLRADYHPRGISASVLILGAIRDAGQGQRMLDESGMKASGFMAPAEAVARGVVKAVTRDKAELVIQPGPGRFIRALMDYFPPSGPPSTGRPGQPPPCKRSSNSARRNQALRYEVFRCLVRDEPAARRGAAVPKDSESARLTQGGDGPGRTSPGEARA